MIPSSPLELFLVLFTSFVSTYLLYGAFKQKDVPRILMGVGAAVPSFEISSFRMWVIAGAIFGAGMYMRNYMDGV